MIASENDNDVVVRLEDVHKTYRTGEMEVHAVRGVSLEMRAANLSRSWARAARANRRS